MNQIQKNYIVAKAAFTAIEDARNAEEAEFLKSKGRAEKHIWMIDDEGLFDLLNKEFSDTAGTFEADYASAREALRAAEKELVSFALSISPEGIRETLKAGSKRVAVREALIAQVLHLDTATMPA
jgi:hypothetical protein